MFIETLILVLVNVAKVIIFCKKKLSKKAKVYNNEKKTSSKQSLIPYTWVREINQESADNQVEAKGSKLRRNYKEDFAKKQANILRGMGTKPIAELTTGKKTLTKLKVNSVKGKVGSRFVKRNRYSMGKE